MRKLTFTFVPLLLLACGREPAAPVAIDQPVQAALQSKNGEEVFAYVAVLSGWVSVIQTATNTEITRIDVGDLPQGVALTPKGEYAYVTNSNSDDVSVIETGSNTVVATVLVGDYPYGVAVTPKGDFVYVANTNSNNVSVIATATNAVVATVDLGAGASPIDVAVGPKGDFAYVTDVGSDNVSVIATATNSVVATIPTGVDPLSVAVSPKGDLLYVTVNNSGTPPSQLWVFKTPDNTPAAPPVPIGGLPLGVAVTPQGNFVYVTSAFAQNMSVIETATYAVVATVSLPGAPLPHDVGITPKGDFAYIANTGGDGFTSGYVSPMATATNTLGTPIAVGGDAAGIAIGRVKGKK